jgi:hypothetical protein
LEYFIREILPELIAAGFLIWAPFYFLARYWRERAETEAAAREWERNNPERP